MGPAKVGRRLEALTGLRMIAALAVFGSHIATPPDAPVLGRFLQSGYNGVTLFFLLSGFVLTWNYAERLGTRPTAGAVWSFGVARFARVYPMYAVALLFVVIPTMLAGGPLPGIWAHVFAVQAWATDLGTVQGYNGPAWSVSVEFFLYACFPILIVLLSPLRRRPRVLLGVIAGVLLVAFVVAWWFRATGRAALPWGNPGSDYRWLYREPVGRLGDFVLGVCAALLVAHARGWRAARWSGPAQVVGALAIVGLMLSRRMLGSVWSWDVAYMLPVLLLVAGLATNDRTLLSRLLSTKILVLLGEASYAFYLLHHEMLGWFHEQPKDTFGGWLVQNAMLLLVIACTAVGAHMVIERPARTGLRRLLDRTRRTTTPAVGEPGASSAAIDARGPANVQTQRA